MGPYFGGKNIFATLDYRFICGCVVNCGLTPAGGPATLCGVVRRLDYRLSALDRM